MHKVSLNYEIAREPADPAAGDLHHPLVALLDAVHRTGSISAAARELQLPYRHVRGGLRRWGAELGGAVVAWAEGRRPVLSSYGATLLWAERRARARLAPQIAALRSELELAFAVAFDDSAGIIPMHASHDEALPRLRELCQAQHKLLLDIQFTSSVEAL